ncbi:MAG: DNA mismatch repair protein MutS [Gammaproteobacteria bacterium]
MSPNPSSHSIDTPMMRQYKALKQQQPNKFLFFRMGDFFELFFEDAQRIASLLDLTLTQRGEVPMAGVPVHSLDNYLARLLRLGESVVICDQVGEAGKSKLMERQITRIVTPGTLSEEELLPGSRDNLVAAIFADPRSQHYGLGWMDVSQGCLFATEMSRPEEIQTELHRRHAREILIPDNPQTEWLQQHLNQLNEQAEEAVKFQILPRPDWEFDAKEGRVRVTRQLEDSLMLQDCTDMHASFGALGALLCYASETLRTQLPFQKLVNEKQRDMLVIDPASRQSLEIDRSLSGDQQATLLAVLDSTSTPMGARLLRNRLHAPTRNRELLEERYNAIEQLMQSPQLDKIQRLMQPFGDLARTLTRIQLGNAPPRDLVRIRNILLTMPALIEALKQPETEPCNLLNMQFSNPLLEQLRDVLHTALVETPPATIRDGGMIASGYDPQLDSLRLSSQGSGQTLRQIEEKERLSTGIRQLKAGYNRVHGYYLEIPRSRTSDLPKEYHIQQTLKNAQRFATQELQQLESTILGLQTRTLEREKWVYNALCEQILAQLAPLRALADALAELDVVASQAERSLSLNLVRPQLISKPILHISEGWHPVVAALQKTPFTANGLKLQPNCRLLLITGPNMGGKSTYMRQTALTVLMAHAGCFVAARSAQIGPIDRILTRIGASDRLGRGQSTFMVEMTELAYLLANATADSLVLLDEIGRGTGTQDGKALSFACLHWFGKTKPCYTLFATHFVELAETAQSIPAATNIHFSAEKDAKNGLRFLYQAQSGPASQSYGLEVAQLAGLPASFLDIAQKEFSRLEYQSRHSHQDQQQLFTPENNNAEPTPSKLRDKQDANPRLIEVERLLNEVQQIDLDHLSPREALDYLYSVQQRISRPSPRDAPSD